MSPSTESAPRAALIGVFAALMLSACAGQVRDAAPDAEPETVGEAEPTGPTPEARYAEALDLMQRNQLGEAQAAFEALSAEVPEKSGPWTNLGLLHARAKRWPAARASFERAIRANPGNAIAHNELGIVLRELRDYPGAAAAYRAAIDADAGYAAPHLNLGLVLDSYLNEPERARQHYRRYLELDGGDDLRVRVWIAEIDRRLAPAAEPTPSDAPAAVSPGAQP
jgi:tetratricopeptide (TPR) repeat protein